MNIKIENDTKILPMKLSIFNRLFFLRLVKRSVPSRGVTQVIIEKNYIKNMMIVLFGEHYLIVVDEKYATHLAQFKKTQLIIMVTADLKKYKFLEA